MTDKPKKEPTTTVVVKLRIHEKLKETQLYLGHKHLEDTTEKALMEYIYKYGPKQGDK